MRPRGAGAKLVGSFHTPGADEERGRRVRADGTDERVPPAPLSGTTGRMREPGFLPLLGGARGVACATWRWLSPVLAALHSSAQARLGISATPSGQPPCGVAGLPSLVAWFHRVSYGWGQVVSCPRMDELAIRH